MKQRIDEWKKRVDSDDPTAQDYLITITEQAKTEGKLHEINEAADYLLKSAARRLDTIEADIAQYTLHEQMGSLSEAINLAYIARNYFGKTRQWLYQRIKGQYVNGKPATFTPDEETTFRNALNDIGLKIHNFTQRI